MNHKEHVLGEMELRPAHAREALRCLLHSILFLRAPGTARPKEAHCRHLRLSFSKLERPTYGPISGDGLSTSYGSSSSSGAGAPSHLHPHQQQQQQQPAPPASLDEAVERVIDGCLHCLTPAGPDLHKGRVVLTLFERRKTQSFFGLVQGEEKVVFEEWVLPLLVDRTGSSNSSSSNSKQPRAASGGFVPVGGEGGGGDGSWEGPDFEKEGEGGEDEEDDIGDNGGVEAVERRRLQERAEALVRARLGEVFQMANASVDHIPPSVFYFELSHQGQAGRLRRAQQGRDLAAKIRNSPALIGHSMGP